MKSKEIKSDVSGQIMKDLKKLFFKKRAELIHTWVEMFTEMQGNHFHENHKSGYFYKGKKGCN